MVVLKVRQTAAWMVVRMADDSAGMMVASKADLRVANLAYYSAEK